MGDEKNSEHVDTQNDSTDDATGDKNTIEGSQNEIVPATVRLNDATIPSEDIPEENSEDYEEEIPQTPSITVEPNVNVIIDEQLIAKSVAVGVSEAMLEVQNLEEEKTEESTHTIEIIEVGEQSLAIDHQITTGDMLLSSLIACNIAVILIARIIKR